MSDENDGNKTMVGKLPSLKPKKVIRALERNGFYIHHTTGSHYILKKGNLRVTVAYHNKDLKPGTLASIIAGSGLTVEEFLDLL
ncbi:MAG: type II toxin-antitoxin system HicA family toxin [Acidobacteria bacterium]|nr:type II toxin-antitoxin system HicA family toxin [Acidobacteriota bacterium]